MANKLAEQEASQERRMRQAAAAFLGEVLGLNETPQHLANDLSSIKRDANAAIYTIQLDSSVGPAAFLVYAYLLEETGGDGRTGQEMFETGLTTLQQAAQRSAPGPRAVAHAEAAPYGFILATTPGTYRALAGEPDLNDLVATNSNLPNPTRPRGEIAAALLSAVRAANTAATEWLEAIQHTPGRPDAQPGSEFVEFNEEETELALFLLDDQSIAAMLQALNLLVSAAQDQTSQALSNSQLPEV